MHHSASGAARPPRDLSVKAANLINSTGVQAASKALGVSRETLARVAAGIPVRAGTLALLRERFAKLAEPTPSDGTPTAA